MKGISAKSVSISLATVALAFVGGVAVTTHQPKASIPLSGTYKAAAATSPASSTDTASPAPSNGSAQVSIVPNPSTPSTTTPTSAAPRATQSPASPSASQSTASDTSATQTAPAPSQSVSTPAVTAVSATVGEWSAPVPAPTSDHQPDGTTVEYQYCTWAYSDSTTQQALMRTHYIYPHGGDAQLVQNVTCTVAAAPAAS